MWAQSWSWWLVDLRIWGHKYRLHHIYSHLWCQLAFLFKSWPYQYIKNCREYEEESVFGALYCLEKAFYSLFTSGERLLGKEVDVFLKGLSTKLAKKWHRSYYQTLNFIKTRFAIYLVLAKKRWFSRSRISTGRISYRVD